jgi:hypothetical protein
MFIIFDSSNQIFDRLIKSTKSEQNSDSFNFRDHLPPINPFKYVGRRNINSSVLNSNTFRQTNDRYPTYGIDIPESCILS